MYNTIDMFKTIKSISFSNNEIINNILELYIPDGIELDPTYSTGKFYKGIKEPTFKFDIAPQLKSVCKADCRHLPIKSNSINSIMFDPPFVIGGNYYNEQSQKEGNCIIAKRFDSFTSWGQLKSFYYDSLVEFNRILTTDGILIFKCQDVVAGGIHYYSHVYIINKAVELGFYTIDLFVLLAKSRLIGAIKSQKHSRSFHSYFIVFKKQNKTISYI